MNVLEKYIRENGISLLLSIEKCKVYNCGNDRFRERRNFRGNLNLTDIHRQVGYKPTDTLVVALIIVTL